MRTVDLVNYSHLWGNLFQEEVLAISKIVGEELVVAHHIGSTAIPGIKAKPVIDILLEVKTIGHLDQYNEQFEKAGYEIKGEFGLPGRRFYQKGGDNRSHHIHAFEHGHPEVIRHIAFRDYLRNNIAAAKEYERIKLALAKQFPHDPQSYTQGKAKFISMIEQNWV